MSRFGHGVLLMLLLAPATLFGLALVRVLLTPAGGGALFGILLNQPELIGNTVCYGALTAVLATGLGWTLAHVRALYTFRGRRALHALALVPLLMPSFSFAMALLVLFGRSGTLTRTLGLGGGGIYGLTGLVLAGTVARLPLAYLAIGSAYRGLDLRVAEAAASLGASPGRIVRSVLWPRIGSIVVATFCTMMADTVADLAVPLVIGGNYGTLAAHLYEAASGEGGLLGAAAHAAWLLPMALVLRPLARRVASRPDAPGAVTSGRARPLDRAGWVALAAGWASVLFGLVLVASVLAGSVQQAVGVDDRLTPTHYAAILAGPHTRALATTVLIALVSAPVVMGLAFGLARLGLSRPLGVTRGVLDALGSVPGVVWGLGAFAALDAVRRPPAQAGAGQTVTAWAAMVVIVSVHTVRFVPVAGLPLVRTAQAQAATVRDAAVTLGVPPRLVARAMLRPRFHPDLIAGTLLVFARTLTAISSVALLTNAYVPLLSVRMLAQVDAGQLSAAAAMNVTLAALVGAAALVARRLGLSTASVAR